MGQPVEAEELLHGGGEEQLQRGVENAAALRPLLLLHLHLHEGPHRLPRAGSGSETKAVSCNASVSYCPALFGCFFVCFKTYQSSEHCKILKLIPSPTATHPLTFDIQTMQ